MKIKTETFELIRKEKMRFADFARTVQTEEEYLQGVAAHTEEIKRLADILIELDFPGTLQGTKNAS